MAQGWKSRHRAPFPIKNEERTDTRSENLQCADLQIKKSQYQREKKILKKSKNQEHVR